MEELLQKIQAACAGLSAEEIASQIAASQYASVIPDIDTLAQFLEAIGAVPVETPNGVEPEQAETEEQTGND
jgi:hypothetical protein